jgi:capsid protein
MVQRHLFITLGLEKVTSRFQELAGVYESQAMLEAIPHYYVPRRYGVDDLKDAQADLLEVQAGFATLESKLEERHTEFEDIAAEHKKVLGAGIKISSFPETLIPEPIAPTAPSTPNSATTGKDRKNPAKTKPTSPTGA